MAYAYIPPPTKEDIAFTFAEWLARLFRVRVVITLDSGERGSHTIEVANPDRVPNLKGEALPTTDKETKK